MRITVFTSNQPRHISLVESLASIAEEVYAVIECNTVFPGQVADFFSKSETMQTYFSYVIDAERKIFSKPHFLPKNVRIIALKMGDVSRLDIDTLQVALDSDVYVVFGASFIKGALCDALVERRAYNIHIGISPYYRGSSCNFWAQYDGKPELVGATIHLLTNGLDSGPILFHALPAPAMIDGFELGMRAVKIAHKALIEHLASGELQKFKPMLQDKSFELRYTRNADFTDAVASNFLSHQLKPHEIFEKLKSRSQYSLFHPYIS